MGFEDGIGQLGKNLGRAKRERLQAFIIHPREEFCVYQRGCFGKRAGRIGDELR
jgi:hypothetical protein